MADQSAEYGRYDIYELPDGRRGLLVFGNRGPRTKYRPLRNGEGQVRVGFLVNGVEQDMRETFYDWVDEADLTYVGRLTKDGRDPTHIDSSEGEK